MKQWLRRIRGAIGIGLTWAVAWFGAGIALLLVVGFGAADVPFPLFLGLLGFVPAPRSLASSQLSNVIADSISCRCRALPGGGPLGVCCCRGSLSWPRPCWGRPHH